MKKQLLIISSVAAFSSVAFAGQEATFGGLDADQDGYISQQEASTNDRLSSNWDNLDTNKDNQLDQSEFSAFEIEKPEGHMEMPKAPEMMME